MASKREVIVSLTSYRPRFGTLALTLYCLLSQTVAPDRVLLWLSEDDARQLPGKVTKLRSHGLDIRTTEDIGSYKKIIPALLAFPDAIIVTADDDIFYEAHWLEALLSAWDGQVDQILCHRAHRIMLDGRGFPRPYSEWMLDTRELQELVTLFPTGVRGVLYPPGALAAAVIDKKAFLRRCPNADDLWLYWMARQAGSTCKLTEIWAPCVPWPGSQDVGLHNDNLIAGGNDRKI